MKLYNTMTNKIEEFKTIEENKVKMYWDKKPAKG